MLAVLGPGHVPHRALASPKWGGRLAGLWRNQRKTSVRPLREFQGQGRKEESGIKERGIFLGWWEMLHGEFS